MAALTSCGALQLAPLANRVIWTTTGRRAPVVAQGTPVGGTLGPDPADKKLSGGAELHPRRLSVAPDRAEAAGRPREALAAQGGAWRGYRHSTLPAR